MSKAKKPLKKTALRPVKKSAPIAKPAAVKAKPVTKVEAKRPEAKKTVASQPVAKPKAKTPESTPKMTTPPVKEKAARPAAAQPEKSTAAPKGGAPVDGPSEAVAEDAEVVLTDAEGRRYCRVKECDQVSMVEGYCRYHYLLFWKRIQVRKKILSEGKLERYVEELTSRYPDKYLEMIRKDLKTEKDFVGAIQELEIDESGVDNEYEDEAQSFIEEVRGISTESGVREDDEF